MTGDAAVLEAGQVVAWRLRTAHPQPPGAVVVREGQRFRVSADRLSLEREPARAASSRIDPLASLVAGISQVLFTPRRRRGVRT